MKTSDALGQRYMDEWLEADGLGGFASGTVSGIRSRRYHGILLAATTPPTGRVMLVNGLEAWLESPNGTVALSSQLYTPEVRHPDGSDRISEFKLDPWPTWRFRTDDGLEIEQEIFTRRGSPLVACSWRARGGSARGLRLKVRPLISGRDIHALHHENGAFRFDPDQEDGQLVWRPYSNLPAIVASTNAEYKHEPLWYRDFLYSEERARGLDFAEDLASPGTFEWKLGRGRAVLILYARAPGGQDPAPGVPASRRFQKLASAERRRRKRLPSRLHRAAETYLVQRGEGKTIIAGYPWFTDWGRDTFIALRGICLAAGRHKEAREILLAWAPLVSEGMLPNRFIEQVDQPEFNSVDAALWYIIAVHEFLQFARSTGRRLLKRDRQALVEAVEAILEGYARGTRHGIGMDDDGLLAAGEPGLQLTWMDAKVGDWVVTPRIGKPVEIQALWLNALALAASDSPRWRRAFARGKRAFTDRFWDEAGGYLYDVVDVDHQPGTHDPSFRPNQILAVGGLPFSLLDRERARRLVSAVESKLLTPIGLRSLAPAEPGYRPTYEGGVWERDGAYHQGTVWPWLLGPFVDAWIRTQDDPVAARREARERFFHPLLAHLDEAGLDHVSEIADAEPPHTPRGCPFQAWSVGEALRIDVEILSDVPARKIAGKEASGKKAAGNTRASTHAVTSVLSCAETFQRLDDYLDRALSPEELLRVEEHLARCAECASEYRFEETLVWEIRAKLGRLAVPKDLLSRVSVRLRETAAAEAR